MSANKIVVITGASRGLGAEWVKRYSADADTTVIAIVRKTTEDSTRPSNVIQVIGDLSKVREFDELATRISEKSGGKIDVLINNAGVMIGSSAAAGLEISTSTVEEWNETYLLNTVAPVFLIKALLPQLKAAHNPRIVNISTMFASREFHDYVQGSMSYASYSASKAALNMANLKFHHEFRKDGMIFITLNPGWVQTEIGDGSSLSKAPLTVEQSIGRCKSFVDRLTEAEGGGDYSLDGLKEMVIA